MSYTAVANYPDVVLYIGSCATGRATAGSTTLDTCVFAQLPGQSAAPTFTAADVGKPIAIVGGGAVDPFMPLPYFVQGATFVTTIAAYVSPSEVTLSDAPTTSIFNTGFYTVILYNPVELASDQAQGVPLAFQHSGSIAPGTRDTAQASVLTQNNAYLSRFEVIVRGQPVYLTNTGATDFGITFGGYIDTLQVVSYPGVAGIYAYGLTCASWAGLATRRMCPPQNAQILTGPGDQVFRKVCLYLMQNDGIAADGDTAPSITLPMPAGAVCSQLLDQIVSLVSTPTTAWYWYADEWRNFHLKKRTAVSAPWNVTSDDLFTGASPYQQSISTTNNQLANFVYGIGSKVLLNSLDVTFHGDGASTTFNLTNPATLTPIITLNSSSQTVGVLGVDTGKQWYWSQGSTTITQAQGATVLQPTDTLVVSYEFATPGVAQAPNSASLVALQQIEGTAAEYDYVFTVQQPIDPVDLLNIAAGYEIEYGNPAQTAQLYTLRPGLKAGQIQNIVVPQCGINGDFLIATVQTTVTNHVLVFQYTAFSGANIGNAITGLVQFINRAQQNGGSVGIVTPIPVIKAGLHEITIDHTKVTGADKTNYIFLFSGTYSWLTGPPSGNVAYMSGVDIYFSSDSAGATVMDFELEYYNSTTGQIVAWVRIPTLSHTTDTVLYIQYGDPANSVSKANPHGVWSPATEVSGVANNNWREVFHLTETTGPYADSTQYANNSVGFTGVGYPARTTGPFAYAIDCPSGSQKGIQVPSVLAGNGFTNEQGTMMAWMKMPSNVSTFVQDIYDAQVSTSSNWGMAIGVRSHDPVGVLNRNGSQNIFGPATAIDDNNWHWMVMTMDTSDCHLYIDGVLVASAGQGQNVAMSDTHTNELNSTGRGNLSFTVFIGQIAEPGITQAVLDADTIATWFANQNSPSTFYSIGSSSSTPPPQTTSTLGNPAGSVTHTVGALTADEPVFGNGGADIKVGTKTGNTDQLQCASGSAGSTGAPLIYDANGNAVAGVTGQLVPTGGTTGQVLAKNSATNYDTGWATSSAVSVTTKGDLQGYSTVPARIPVGSDGQVLQADSTQALGVKWAAGGGSSPLTTKGDVWGFSTTDARIPVGSNGQVLTADSTQTLGLKWAAAAAGSAIDCVQSWGKRGNSLAFPLNVTSGNILVAVCSFENATDGAITVSDTLTTTWSQAVKTFGTAGGNGEGIGIYVGSAPSSGADTVSFTAPGSFYGIHIAEFSGVTTTTDGTAGLNSTSANPPGALALSITPTADGDLVICAVQGSQSGGSSGCTQGSLFSFPTSGSDSGVAAWVIQNKAGKIASFVWNTSAGITTVMAALKHA